MKKMIIRPIQVYHRTIILRLVGRRCLSTIGSRVVTNNVTTGTSTTDLTKTTPSFVQLQQLCHGHQSSRRYYSTEKEFDDKSSQQLVYSGPLTSAVKAIKLFSISTAICAITFSPILVYFGNPATPVVGRIAIASLVTTVGLSTTFILHWFIKSYVTKLYFNRVTGNVTVETLSLFGRKKLTKFHVSQAQPPDALSAFSTFQGGGKHFFMHTELFEDPQLLRQLLGSYAAFERDIKPEE